MKTALLIPVAAVLVLPGCAMVPTTEPLDVNKAEALLETISVLPARVLDPSPMIFEQNSHSGRARSTSRDYQEAIRRALKESGLAERVIPRNEEERVEGAYSPLVLSLELEKAQVEDLRPNWLLPVGIIFFCVPTFGAGTPIMLAWPISNNGARAEGSIRLVDERTKTTVLIADVKVTATSRHSAYNWKDRCERLEMVILRNLAVSAVEQLRSRLEEDATLRERVASLSRASPAHRPIPRPDLRVPRAGAAKLADRYAIIVGLSQYQHSGKNGLTNLAFADDDAIAFSSALIKQGWDHDHIKCLIDKRASRSEVEKWLRYGPDLENSLLVVFWSGHGYPDPADQRKLFLACYDTDIPNPATGLRMSDVRHWLEERKARNVVILADACHAGGMVTGKGVGGVSATDLAGRMRPEHAPPGWIYLLGARTGEKAIEHPKLRGGLFTHSLTQALSGQADGYGLLGNKDGTVTLGEIREYVRDKVRERAFQLNLTGAFEIVDQTNTGDRAIWNLSLRADRK